MNNIPKGYKLVPVEPTEEMIEAASYEYGNDDDVYRVMLAAAPAPPQPIYDEAKELERCRAFWNQGHPLVAFGDLWTGWRARAMAGEDK